MSFKDGEATRFRNFGANSGPPQKNVEKNPVITISMLQGEI